MRHASVLQPFGSELAIAIAHVVTEAGTVKLAGRACLGPAHGETGWHRVLPVVGDDTGGGDPAGQRTGGQVRSLMGVSPT